MISFRFALLATILATAAWAQGAPQSVQRTEPQSKTTAADRHDFSGEPFVIEDYSTKARFEDDGTGQVILHEKIRVQDDGGVEQLRTLTFDYDSSHEAIALHYLRVHSPRGGVTNAGTDAIKESVAEEASNAPAYANHKEQKISVPALAAGAVLEYEIAKSLTKPYAPNQFWMQHSFITKAIVLNESLEISVPEDKAVLVKQRGASYQLTRSGGRSNYSWQHENLSIAPDESTKENKYDAPNIELSSFKSWDEIGRWYKALDQAALASADDGARAAAPQIRAEVERLVATQTTDEDKLRAIYDYVSKKIRYVEIPLGTIGYQPRSPADVLASGYGDAKDKNELLVGMLRAAGFQANVALTSSSAKISADLPSPSEFNYVLSVVSRGKETFWMDSTEPVIPFRMLPSALRGKPALRLVDQGSSEMTETPADPPFPSTQEVDIHAQLTPLGKLVAQARYTLRGDNELALRLAFYKTPSAQWNELARTMLALDGLRGNVTSVKPGDPTATADSFPIDIDFAQPGFVDWASSRSTAPLPLPNIGLPDEPRKSTDPIALGSALRVSVRLEFEFPPSFSVQSPVGVSINRDYAEFQSAYHGGTHTLMAERSLDFKRSELPAARADDFQSFSRAVTADESQSLIVANSNPAIPADASESDLFDAGHAALEANNFNSALPLLQKVTAMDPEHKRAWGDLGLIYLRQSKPDDAVSAFEKQLAIDPSYERGNEYLGAALEAEGMFPEAINAFRKQAAANPLDAGAHAALGEALLRLGRDPEAAAELEKSTILAPKNATMAASLGEAYLAVGDDTKALAAFEKAANLSPTPRIWNAAAFELADHGVALETAQKFASSALRATIAVLHQVDRANPSPEQWSAANNLAIDWDTFGWVCLQEGNFPAAERYVSAAWQLGQNGLAAEHLAQIYVKRGDREKAAHTLALALAAPHPSPDARARLTLLLGGNAQIDGMVDQARPEIAAMRTWKLPAQSSTDASAGFILQLSNGEARTPVVVGVRQISGSDSLKPFAQRLRTLDYHFAFPDAQAVTIPRQVVIWCSAKSNECSLTLLAPEDVPAH